MKAVIQFIVKAIRKALTPKSTRKMTPTKIQGKKSPAQQKKKQEAPAKQDAESPQENDNFFTDRVEAGGTPAMRRFYKTHQQRLRNQDKGHGQSNGQER